jgi:hypothetical protein
MTLSTVSDTVELVVGATATIKPTAVTGEWIIHNIYLTQGASAKVEFGDATYWVNINTLSESWTNMYSHVTYTNYLRVTNNGASTIYVAYDGVSIV